MALKKEEKKEIKDEKITDEQMILMNEEEWNRKQHLEIKENLNRILRIVGLVGSILLIYVVFDTLFELSYFGWMFDRPAFDEVWSTFSSKSIFDDPMEFGTWIAQLMITIILIITALGTVYLITYNIVDFIVFVKNLIKLSKNIAADLSTSVKTDVTEEFKKDDKKKSTKKEKKEKNLFSDDEIPAVTEVPKKERKRKEKESSTLSGYTTEQLDALLRGESLESEINTEEPKTEGISANTTDNVQ